MNYHVKLETETLRKYRIFNELTREQLAKMVGISENLIYKLEKNRAPLTANVEETLRQKLGLTDAKLVTFNTLADAIERE